MKTFIKHTLWMAMLLLALPGEGQAQTFYRENETAIDIFHKLDELFPKRFLTQRWMTGAQYWVQHWYETPSDYQAHKAQVAALFNELDETPYFHKNIDMTDSAGVQRAKYIMSFPSDIRGQQDYLTLTADNTGVWFYYQATNRFANLKADDIPDQSIVEELDLAKGRAERRSFLPRDIQTRGTQPRTPQRPHSLFQRFQVCRAPLHGKGLPTILRLVP